MPTHIRPLKPGRRHNDVPKPHPAELCQKCIELGSNCQEYRPPPGETVDIPDDQSIISVASTASSSSFVDDQHLSDEDITPQASDEEDIDSFLQSKMKSMDINKKQ